MKRNKANKNKFIAFLRNRSKEGKGQENITQSFQVGFALKEIGDFMKELSKIMVTVFPRSLG